MKLPQIQARLKHIAEVLHEGRDEVNALFVGNIADEIRDLANEIGRRPYEGQRQIVSRPCTPKLREAIREYASANPKLTQMEVAKHFNVNAGRVSEALHGFRK